VISPKTIAQGMRKSGNEAVSAFPERFSRQNHRSEGSTVPYKKRSKARLEWVSFRILSPIATVAATAMATASSAAALLFTVRKTHPTGQCCTSRLEV
jgi:hypothetical protein